MKTKLLLGFILFTFQFAVAKEVVFVDPVAPSVPPLTYCDTNNDGFGVFDLTSQNSNILAAQSGSASDYAITYHETLTQANIGSSPLASPYYNIYPNSQTVYYRIRDLITSTYAVGSFELVVNTTPFVGSVSSIAVCDADSNPLNGSTSVDLTQQTTDVLAMQPLAASNYTVSFYTNQILAELGSTPIINDASYIGSNGQTIWYRVENNVSSCYNVGSFQLIINAPLTLTTPTVLTVCDDDAYPNNNYTTFDLTVKNFEITQGLPGYTVTYFPSLANAQAGTNPIANPTSYINSVPTVQTLGVRVSDTTPLGCQSLTTLDIRVYPIPTPNTNPNTITVCDTDGDGLETVDLTVNSTYIINGDSNLVLYFYHTMADAITNVNQILGPANAVVGGNVWIRVENNRIDYQGNHCFVLVEQPIVISGLPMVTEPNYPQYALYDYGNDGYETFDLTTQIGNILLGQTGMTVAFYPSFVDAQNDTNIIMNPSAYVNTVIYVQTLGIRVFNSITGCYSISTIDILVTPEVPSPVGLVYWTFTPGQTLADIVIYGNNIQWYSSALGRTALSTPLPLSTLLVDGTTYYASQTINNVESTSRLAVTVHSTLEVNDNEILPIQYAPNPVKSNLTLQSKVIIKSVSIYTMLGQKVVEQKYNDTTVSIDLSRLATGNYILKAQGETGQKTLRIIKE